jgi:hypothetical protein
MLAAFDWLQGVVVAHVWHAGGAALSGHADIMPSWPDEDVADDSRVFPRTQRGGDDA